MVLTARVAGDITYNGTTECYEHPAAPNLNVEMHVMASNIIPFPSRKIHFDHEMTVEERDQRRKEVALSNIELLTKRIEHERIIVRLMDDCRKVRAERTECERAAQ